MYFRYKVNWNMDNKAKDETGLVYANDKVNEGYTDAMEKICEYFDSINKVELEAFSPDDCLEVSAEALDAIQENVLW